MRSRPHSQSPRVVMPGACLSAAPVTPTPLCGMPPAADAPAGRSTSAGYANRRVRRRLVDRMAAPFPCPAAEPCGSAPECRCSSVTLHRTGTGSASHNGAHYADVDPFRRTPAWPPVQNVRLAHSPHILNLRPPGRALTECLLSTRQQATGTGLIGDPDGIGSPAAAPPVSPRVVTPDAFGSQHSPASVPPTPQSGTPTTSSRPSASRYSADKRLHVHG